MKDVVGNMAAQKKLISTTKPKP